ncbi:uncharacterized protein PAC_09269 [Phialocephala subalpina]|uniref:Uncharacterized protein n=1 Tax=Phialocephala subalpina TaxID=576137 RepID=A0A1L7X306_9HELO|nr:uncharacterized protein PAC_09269 [Phialocephala subalpina]
MVFGSSTHDPNRKLFDNFDPNAAPKGTFSNPFFFEPGAAPPRPPPAHSLGEQGHAPVSDFGGFGSRAVTQTILPSVDTVEPSKQSTVPDETLGGTWELEPPPPLSPPPQPSLPPLRPFPFEAMDNLMRQLREEEERKVRRTPEEVLAEEAAGKTMVEEQWRLKREREKNVWSSCHLFSDGTGMSMSGPIVRDEVTGEVRYEEWPKVETGGEGEKVVEEAESGSTGNEKLVTAWPEDTEEEKKSILAQKATNPFDDAPNSNPLLPTERKKHQEDAKLAQLRLQRHLQLAKLFPPPRNQLRSSKGEDAEQKVENTDEEKMEGEKKEKRRQFIRKRVAQIDYESNLPSPGEGIAETSLPISRNPYINDMKNAEFEKENKSIVQQGIALDEQSPSGIANIQPPEESVYEKEERSPKSPKNPFNLPNPFTLSARKQMQQLEVARNEDEEENESKLAWERWQQLEIRRQQHQNIDEQTLSGTTMVAAVIDKLPHPLDGIPSLEEAEQEKKRLSKQRLEDHFNPEVAESGRASLALKRSSAHRSKYQFEADSEDDEGEKDNGETILGLQELVKGRGNETEGCSGFCSYPLRLKNGDVDEKIKIARARLDRIR